MANQQQLMAMQQQGDWAALAAAAGTPAGSFAPATTPVPGPQPSGMTPNAKRPRAPVAAPASTKPTQAMTNMDLTAGFHNMIKSQARDQAHAVQVNDSVHWNAGLLNALVARVNALETSQKLEAIKVDQLQGDVQTAVNTLDKQDAERDTKLRKELDQMAVRLEKSHAEVEEKLNKMGTANPVDVPLGIAPGNN